MIICPHCKEEIPDNHVQQGGLHMGCYGTEIQVYLITMEDGETGYYDKNLDSALESIKPDLEESGETAYKITPKMMKAGWYYNLPDFEGF